MGIRPWEIKPMLISDLLACFDDINKAGKAGH